MDRKKLLSQSWPECPTSLSYVYIADKETQADNNNTCNHEEEIKRRVIKELDIIYNHLLEYNRDNFGRFMQDLSKKHEERIEGNRQLRHEIENMRMQVLEAEEVLASMKRS